MRYLVLASLLLVAVPAASSSDSAALEMITFTDIGQHDLFGAACNFSLVEESNTMLFIGMDDGGYLKAGGAIVELAPDPKSAELSFGAREAYSNGAYRVQMTVEGEGVQTGYEVVDYNGELTVRDAGGEVVLSRRGLVECGA
jgi:hypothetical protein